jgi:hypothetical protein
MSVEVDFFQWGWQYQAKGTESYWWYTWEFDQDHWARMSAVPWNNSPRGASIQIVEEWATPGKLHVHWRNNGTEDVSFRPTAIMAPGRFKEELK